MVEYMLEHLLLRTNGKENRLDHALVRFNEALAVNKQLREEIDHLRRERVVFDNINR